ncbi:MAG: DUF1905 domain-containing protein [Candidatus Promineofilum sp.]|nr:DUF1905 domain-containing protein [Promineifilum sp.]
MKATYTTTILKDDEKNATGIPVLAEVIAALGAGKRPPVVVHIGGHSYRSTVAAYGDVYMLPLSQAHRTAAGVEAGQSVEITLELDTQPRTVDVPDDLAAALAEPPGLREAFDALSYSARKEHVRQVTTAKAAETRQRRIAKIVAGLAGG